MTLPSRRTYPEAVDAHPPGDLVEGALHTLGVGVEHRVEAGERSRSTKINHIYINWEILNLKIFYMPS